MSIFLIKLLLPFRKLLLINNNLFVSLLSDELAKTELNSCLNDLVPYITFSMLLS